mmetsp:Transcript_37871/g.100189  ORF Transcript_37871/g.100189 Transcript_37871/m.100189 type:complete len:224 (+) Transcript_37871:3-674(+)
MQEGQLVAVKGPSGAEILKEQCLWEGWAHYYKTLPLGPGREVPLDRPDSPDPSVCGFAYPLPPVEFALRNERKFPPITEEEQLAEMFRIVRQMLDTKFFKTKYVLSIVFSHINRNKRDSLGWQRAFIRVGGVKRLIRLASSEDEMVRYWAGAILGRMLGTSEESRRHLIATGAADVVLKLAKDIEEEVRDCAICAIKGFIQSEEGRKYVTYETLIECLAGGRK